MNWPTDWNAEVYSKKPICGVLSCAMVANTTFAAAEKAIKNNLMPHQKRHGGRTYHEQRRNALTELGVQFREHFISDRITLNRWVKERAIPGHLYMVTTSSHVVTVTGGWCADQYEISPIDNFGARRCYVREVLEIVI